MDNATVAHRWSNQIENKRTKRIEGSSGNGNLYFKDKTIYSYGSHFPLATLTNKKHKNKNIILFNDSDYSFTTNQHKSRVLDAIDYDKNIVLKCELNLLDSWYMGFKEFEKNNITTYIRNIVQSLDKYSRARKSHTKNWYLNTVAYNKESLKLFVKCFVDDDYFKTDAGIIHKKEISQVLNNRKHNKLVNEFKTWQIQEDKKQKELFIINLDLWRNHKPLKNRSSFHNKFSYLRLNQDKTMVQSSRGVNINSSEFITLYKLYKRGVNIEGKRIKHFLIERVTDKHIKINCHIILLREIEDIVTQLTPELIEVKQ